MTGLVLQPSLVATGLAMLLGAVAGSLINAAVMAELPESRRVCRAGACSRFEPNARWHERIPIISWLALNGECKHCAHPIPASQPMVEAGTSLAFGLLTWLAYQEVFTPAALAAMLAFAGYGIALSIIDIATQRLPNRIVGSFALTMFTLLALASWATHDWRALLRACVGAAALFAFFAMVKLINPAGMGGGDVKLAGVIGLFTAWFGFTQLFVAVLASFIIGSIVGFALISARRAGRNTPFAFGPAMLAGAWIGVFWGVGTWV